MTSDRPLPPALSLQQKLDHIAHERDVLALLRELAQSGLREGDRVRAVDGHAQGRLAIAREQSPPRLVVACDDGSRSDYRAGGWHRA